MAKKNNSSLSKEKAFKRKKVLQEMIRSISNYEKKASAAKNTGKKQKTSTGNNSALKRVDCQKRGASKNQQAVKADKASEKNFDGVKREAAKEKSKFYENEYFDSGINLSNSSLSDEEKNALRLIVKQIQNEKDDKLEKNDLAKITEEMHEIVLNEINSDDRAKAKSNRASDILQEGFLDFNVEFDSGMLFKDTNLDMYSDLFTKSELQMLKEKQRQLREGTLVFDKPIEVSEDDFLDIDISEDDFLDSFLISEDDFE